MKRDTNLDVWGDYSRDLLRVVDSLCTWPLVDEHNQNWIQSSSKTSSSSSSLASTQSNSNVTNEITCDNSTNSSNSNGKIKKREKKSILPTISRNRKKADDMYYYDDDDDDDDASSVASDCVPWGMTDEDALDEIDFTRELMGYEEGFDDYNYHRRLRILKEAEEEAEEEEREAAKANNRQIQDTAKNHQPDQNLPVVSSSSRIKFRRPKPSSPMKKNVESATTNQQARTAAATAAVVGGRQASPLRKLPLIRRRISIPKKYPNFISSPASPRRDTNNPPSPSSAFSPPTSPILLLPQVVPPPMVMTKVKTSMPSATTNVDAKHMMPSLFVSTTPASPLSSSLTPTKVVIASTSSSPAVECTTTDHHDPKPPPVMLPTRAQRQSPTKLLQNESGITPTSKEIGNVAVEDEPTSNPNPLVRMTRSLNGVSSGIQLVYDMVPVSSSLSPTQEKQGLQSFSIPINSSSSSSQLAPLPDMTHHRHPQHRRTRSGGSAMALAASSSSLSHYLPLRSIRHGFPSNTITTNGSNSKSTTLMTTTHSKPPTWRNVGHHRRTRSNGELLLVDSEITKSKDAVDAVDGSAVVVVDSNANIDIDAHRFKWFPHFNHKSS